MLHLFLLSTLSTAQDLSFGTSVTSSQSTPWAYFQLKDSPQAYNIATLQLQDSGVQAESWPLFSFRVGIKPAMTPSGELAADLSDQSALTSRKLTHYLTIPGSMLSSTQAAYLGIYIGDQAQEWTYSLQLTASTEPLCPSDCQNRGNCMDGKCVCYPGFVDVDCGVVAVLLEPTFSKTVKATNLTASFAYVRWSDSKRYAVPGSSASVQVTWGNGSPLFISKAGKSVYRTWMPLPEERDEMKTSSTRPLNFDISSDDCDYWYFSVSDSNPSSTLPLLTYWNVTVSSESELNKLLVVLVSLSCGLVVFWACFAVYKWKRARPAPVETNYRAADSTGLPSTLLDQHFPRQVHSHYAKDRTEGQDKCPICLDLWTAEAEVRVLSCDHEYHVKCIDSWFESNTVRDK